MEYFIPDIAINGGGYISDSRASAEATTIPASINFISTGGYAASGDLGNALYKRVSSDAGFNSCFQSADGSWWQIVPDANGFNWCAFGCVGDDATDNTLNGQNCIDYVASLGGGIITIPGTGTFIGNWVIRVSGLTIQSMAGVYSNLPTTPPVIAGPTLKAKITGAVISTNDTDAPSNVAIKGIAFEGLGAGTPCVGIKTLNCARWMLEQLSFNNFADEAHIQDSDCYAYYYENVFAENCLLNTARGSQSGVMTIGGTDNEFNYCEITASVASKTASGFCSAWYITGSNNWFYGTVGEISDTGYVLGPNAAHNKFIGCRADLNRCEGFIISGTAGANLFIGCHSLENGLETANTYSAFKNAGTVNTFSGCIANGYTNTYKYCFEDTTNGGNANLRPTYNGCIGYRYGTSLYGVNGFQGAHVLEGTSPIAVNSGATPDSTGSNTLVCGYASPTTITNVLGGTPGKVVNIIGNANTTLGETATIKTKAGANTLVGIHCVTIVYHNGVWFQT